MASRFVVAVALFAVCHSSTIGVSYRGMRSITNAEASAESLRGPNQASAAVDDNKSKAYGITDDGGKAYAKADTQDTQNAFIRIGNVQPTYYHVPAPATVVTYQQNYETPYAIPAAPSTAQSSAITQGGYGSASSNANADYGRAAANSRTQGSGFGSTSSLAQTNGFVNAENLQPVVIAARDHGLRYPYNAPSGPNSASSNANVHGQGSAGSYANVGAVPTRKSISWRFGTAYDHPAAYASGNNYGSASANSDANASYGSLRSNAQVQNAGTAQSAAYNTAGVGSANSAVTSNGAGAANANAIVRNTGYTVLESGDNASVTSSANSFGQGSAKSSAISNGGAYGLRSTGWGGRIASDAHSNGSGYAASSANKQAVNSLANANTWGSAGANAYSA